MTGRMAKALSRGPLHVVILTICFLWTLPSVGLFISSLRPRIMVEQSGWWDSFGQAVRWVLSGFQTPFAYTLENYATVLTAQGMGQAFINSLIITVPALILNVGVAAFAAYAFAWMSFRGRDVLFIVVVAFLVVPLQMTLIPVLKLYTSIGLTSTFAIPWLGIWLAHTAYGLPYSVYLLRNFFSALPKDLFESAFLDGASQFTVFFRLVLPLSVPALASLAIFQFLWVWNDLLVALTFLGGNPSVAPLTLPISNLVSSMGAGWHLLTAAAFVSMALPLVVFFGLQRYFVRGILAGSVKG